MLKSDLRGHIANINQYFTENSSKTRTLLDFVMMTHGWRRFNWQEILEGQTPSLLYPQEENLAVAGKVLKSGTDDPVKATVSLSVLALGNFTSTDLTTDSDGLFYFSGLGFQDTTSLMLQAAIPNARKKKKSKEGEFKLQGKRDVDIELINLQELKYNP